MQELQIAMLGARGVGKTSLLTAMCEQFDNTIGQANLQLTPDLESAALLGERLAELKSLLDDFEAKGGIGATETPRSFVFSLGRKGGKPSLQLHFRDYPGDYLNADANSKNRKFVKELITECAAVLIVIDAPALMEADGKWHHTINRPQQITNLFKSVYFDLTSPRLVIFAPVRCEKYLQDEKSAAALLRRVKDGYANLLDLFKSDLLRPWIVSVVTPVQTVGSVVFSWIDVVDKTPCFHFRKTSHDAEYCPQDSEQPLRYLLRFLLNCHLREQKNWGIFNCIRDYFGWDNYLKEAARKSAEGCKSTGGFAILQGEEWLRIR